jgi:Integral membrane protein CcmA involved in cell shape determination
MGFLSKNAKAGEYISVISEECQFQGTLDLQGSLRIDGKLEGNVNNAKYVTINKTGSVKGDITAQGVVVMGKMDGNLCADSVEILTDAVIKGNIRSKNILIEGGAKVNADIRVVGEETPAEEETVAEEPVLQEPEIETAEEEVKKETKRTSKKGDK